MKIGIVGSSKADIKQSTILIMALINKYPKDTEFVSGGAKGIDEAVEEACYVLSRQLTIFKPKINKWEGGYKERNLKIARYCDEVICIALATIDKKNFCYHCNSDKHDRTGGCYTARLCKKFRMVVME